MKIIKISFERFENNKEIHYSLCGTICDKENKKLLKKKINEIIDEVFKNGNK